MSSTLLPPPREQLCNRSCSNKTHSSELSPGAHVSDGSIMAVPRDCAMKSCRVGFQPHHHAAIEPPRPASVEWRRVDGPGAVPGGGAGVCPGGDARPRLRASDAGVGFRGGEGSVVHHWTKSSGNGGASADVSRSRGRRLQGCLPLECSVRSDKLPMSM